MDPGARIRAAGSGVFGYFARHPTAANLLMVVMLALGLAAATQIRSQFFPDVVIETVEVTVPWDGAGPEDIDAGITALLEPVLMTVEGVESSEALAREGSARIRLDFEPGWDMDRATADIRTALAGVTTLPAGAEEPEVQRRQWRDRVTDVVIHGPVSIEQLGGFADEFAQRLYRAGITRTDIQGIADPVIRVEMREADLIRHSVTLRDVADAIGAATRTTPAGEVDGSATRLRAGGDRRGMDALGEIVLRDGPDGTRLVLRDVAELRVEGADSGRAFYRDGQPAVSLTVSRSAAGDAIDMQARTAEIAAEMQPLLPVGVRIDLVRTRAEGITDRLSLLFRNGAMGLALVVGLLFLFLSARTAIWVAAGIPVAMIAAVGLMFAAGLTINVISLFGLILCLGLVVDDAIVVAEHADWRRRVLGEPAEIAAESAARRMALPVFSAMVTTVLAFFGLTAIGGRFGALIADIPFTVIVVLCASLVECFLILPHHMVGALGGIARTRVIDGPSRAVNRALDWVRARVFLPLMSLVIRLRYPVLAAMVLLVIEATGLFVSGTVPWRFYSSPERGSITGNVAMLPGATREDTFAMVRELERAVAAVDARFEAEHGRAPVTSALAQVGGTSGRGLAGEEVKEPDTLGAIDIELIAPDDRPYSSTEFVSALEVELVRPPMLETLSFRSWGSGPEADAIDVAFYGPEPRVLKDAAEALKSALASNPLASGLEDTLGFDKSELLLELTPLGQRLGFGIGDVGADLRARLSGLEAAELAAGSRTVTVEVGLAGDEIAADFLDRARIRAPGGAYVPVSEVVTMAPRAGFSSLERENGRGVVRVTGAISEDDPVAAAALARDLEARILPEIAARFGVDVETGGLAAEERDFLGDALTGFALCLLGIYLALAWVFASWLRPVVVLLVIPLGLVGTFWGHYRWDLALSMFSVVGLIGLSGIIINNAIVLITTIDDYARDRPVVPAVIAAAGDRLRPILLTTLTTVLGLAPLVFERSQQALFLKPTVVTLVYGLGAGSVLVLLVVPALVVIQRDIGRAIASFRRGLGARGAAGPLRMAMIAATLWFAAIFAPWFATGGAVGPARWLAGRIGGGDGWSALAALALGLAAISAMVIGAEVRRRR